MVRADLDLILGVVLAAESQSGRDEAMRLFEEMKGRHLPGAYLGSLLETPLLVGRYEAARDAAKEFLMAPRTANEWRWFKYTIEHYAGVLSEDELLRRAGPFSNAQCMSHFCIGMKALSLGEREKAKRHFQQAIATRRIGWYNHSFAKRFLLRMETDPDWPDWIPVRDEGQSCD